MKRILPGLLTIALTFVFACSSHSIKHPTKDGYITGSTDTTLKTVSIIVGDGTEADSVISVVPDPIKLKVGEKIKWVVSNNRGDGQVAVKIDTFLIDGSTNPESPFKSGKTSFDLTRVESGTSAAYPAGDDTTAAKTNTYKYTIHASVTSASGTVTRLKDLDPRIVVSQ